MSIETDWQPTFDGLSLPKEKPSSLEIAAKTSLAALDAAGLLSNREAVIVQLVLDLAKVTGRAAAAGQAAAAALAAKQLMEALERLPSAPAEAADPFEDLMTRLSEVSQ